MTQDINTKQIVLPWKPQGNTMTTSMEFMNMTNEIYLVIQVLGIAFLGGIIGNMLGYRAGHRDASEIWQEAYKQE